MSNHTSSSEAISFSRKLKFTEDRSLELCVPVEVRLHCFIRTKIGQDSSVGDCYHDRQLEEIAFKNQLRFWA